jgi:hypothetical protein
MFEESNVFSTIPTGLCIHSPRLPYSATLGSGISMRSNPNGGCASRAQDEEE